MAITTRKLKNIIKKNIRYPTLIGIVFSIVLVAQYYSGHDAHERKFIQTQVRVIDGDTIILGKLRIRLQGIDAPELTQECRDKKSMKVYKCGETAKEYLNKSDPRGKPRGIKGKVSTVACVVFDTLFFYLDS